MVDKIPQNIGQNYTVATNGEIKLESMKDKPSIFNVAKKYDKDGNGVLEHDELREYLNTVKNKNENNQFTVYKEEFYKDGGVYKRNLLMKHDDSQITFLYKPNGEPASCNLVLPDGSRHLIYFDQKCETYFPDKNDMENKKNYTVSDENLQKFKTLAEGKELSSSMLDKILQKVKSLFGF